MLSFTTKLSHALRWNSIEAIAYHSLLVAHQVVLYRHVSPSDYGMIGTLFACVYLIVGVMNAGLDPIMGAYFDTWGKSKNSITNFMLVHLMPNYCIGLLLMTGGLWHAPTLWPTLAAVLTRPLIGILAITIISESTKKTIKHMLHLSFANRVTACAEIGTILCFNTMVWSLYACGYPLTMITIFTSLMTVSLASALFLGWHLYRWHATKPHGHAMLPHRLIFTQRFFATINQIAMVPFSGNFLVPFFASTFGMAHAGALKLVTNVVYGINSGIQKIFGSSSTALFAHTKSNASVTRQCFAAVTTRLHQTLIGISGCAILHYVFICDTSAYDTTFLACAFLYFIMGFVDNFVVQYEKLHITHEQTHILAFINGSACLSMLTLCCVGNTVAPFILLGCAAIMRMLSCFALHWYAHNTHAKIPYMHLTFRLFVLILVLLSL